ADERLGGQLDDRVVRGTDDNVRNRATAGTGGERDARRAVIRVAGQGHGHGHAQLGRPGPGSRQRQGDADVGGRSAFGHARGTGGGNRDTGTVVVADTDRRGADRFRDGGARGRQRAAQGLIRLLDQAIVDHRDRDVLGARGVAGV